MTNKIEIKMYFGLNMPQGGIVSPGDWDNFEKTVISFWFDGFNVVDSYGYWKGKKEQSKVITVIMDESDKWRAKNIAEAYCKTFGQEAVLIVAVPVLSFDFITE